MAFVKPGWEVRVVDESEYIPRETMPLTDRELFVDFPRLVMGEPDMDKREALIREHFPQLSEKQISNLKLVHKLNTDDVTTNYKGCGGVDETTIEAPHNPFEDDGWIQND